MNVLFEFDLPGGETITEHELAQADAALLAQVAAIASPEGGLVLSDPARGQSTAIGDVLGALISGFCCDAVSPLRAGQPYATTLFAYDEQVTFTPDGEDVVVTGDELESARFSLRELLPALVACGERYAAHLRRLHGSNPAWSDRLAMTDAAAQTARTQLEAAL
jgi:hypothetical protein